MASYKLPFQLKDTSLLQYDSFVHGEWVQSKSGTRFEVVDPGTTVPWASCPDNDASDVDTAVGSAARAFGDYRKWNPRHRAQRLMEWYRIINENKDDIATILTYETGKPISESYAEIAYSTRFVWWFAGEAERVRGTVFTPSAPNRRAMTFSQPIGVVAALVPWNFPIAMILRKVSAALAAGCTVVAKPSPETPITTLLLASTAVKAGFPPGVFNVLTTSLENTPLLSEALCKHHSVKKVTFTGSTRVGQIVASHCAVGLKKLTMELGGNCPFIVFDDGDLGQAVEQLMGLKWRHAGQACITANRIYVQSGVYERFISLFRDQTAALVVGHGAESATTLGPVTTFQGVQKAHRQISDAISKGAKIVLGGAPDLNSTRGFFVAPTILSEMNPDMLISSEESFCPIAAIYRFDTEDEAVTHANNTSMGLATYAFTQDVDRVWRMMENLEAGMVGVNCGNQSAAESPFGGIKESGYGKESGKDVAIAEYLVTKTATFILKGQY